MKCALLRKTNEIIKTCFPGAHFLYVSYTFPADHFRAYLDFQRNTLLIRGDFDEAAYRGAAQLLFWHFDGTQCWG